MFHVGAKEMKETEKTSITSSEHMNRKQRMSFAETAIETRT